MGKHETAETEQLRRRDHQQSLVAELGRSALAGGTLARLVSDAVAAAAAGLGADRVAVFEPDGEQRELAAKITYGWPIDDEHIDVDADSPVARTYRERDPSLTDTLAAVPVRGEDAVVGVLAAARPEPCDAGDVLFLRAVADIVAGATWRERAEVRRRRAEAALDVLADAHDRLAGSLDRDAVLGTLADLVVPRLADWCIVAAAEEGGAVRAAEPRKREILEELHREYPALRIAEVTPEASLDERELELLEELDPRAATAVALVARGRVLGTLTLGWSQPADEEEEPDAALAEELAAGLADRAALAIDDARLAMAAEALDSIAEGVVLVDGGGAIRVWNAAAEAITGLHAADVRGRAADDLLDGWRHGVDATGPAPHTVAVAVGGRELELSISCAPSADGSAYAFRDVTAERRLDRMKSDFVATVSHELRTPLAAVYGAAVTLLERDLTGKEELQRDLVLQIAEQSERLSAIIEDILFVGKVEAGALRLQPAAVDAAEVARAAVDTARARAGSVVLELDAADGMPALETDAVRLRQVLDNLLDNAIKYSPDGGAVVLRVDADARWTRFAVADNGVGIPGSEQSRIFEKFYRLDREQTRGVNGTGLGLYVCRELVERMEGRLTVDSTVGLGSTFLVELPRR